MQAEQVQHVNDALLQLTKELAADVDVASLAATVTCRLQWLLHAATVNFFLVDKATDSLVWLQPVSDPGAAEAIVAPVKFPMRHGLVGQVAATGEALIMEKAFKHPKFDYTIDQCNVVPPGVDSSGSPQPGSGGLRDLHGTQQDSSKLPSTPPATSRSSSTDGSLPPQGMHARSGSLSMLRSTSSSDLNGQGSPAPLPGNTQLHLSVSLSTGGGTKVRRKSAHASALNNSDQPASALPTGVNVLSCLIVPVKNSDGEVVAVIQAVNKSLAASSGQPVSTPSHQQSRATEGTARMQGDTNESKGLRQRFTEPNLFAAIPRPGSSPVLMKRPQNSTPTGSNTSELPGGRRRMRSSTETSDVMLVTSTTSNRSAMASPRRPRFNATGGSPVSNVGSQNASTLPPSPAADFPIPPVGLNGPQGSNASASSGDRLHTMRTERVESLGSDSSLLDSDVRGVAPYSSHGTGITLPVVPDDGSSAGHASRPTSPLASGVAGTDTRRAQSLGESDGLLGAWGVLPATENLRNAVIPFTASDASVAEGVSASVGVCLQKALMFEAISQAQRQTAAMLDIVKATSEEQDIATLMKRMMAAVFRALEADRVTLFLVDHAAKELWVLISRGDVDGVRVPMDRGIVGHVATTGCMVAVRDAYRNELFNPEIDQNTGYRTKSVLCMPVVDDRGHVVAVVEALNKLSPFEKARRSAAHGKEAFRLRTEDSLHTTPAASVRSTSRQGSSGGVARAHSGDSAAGHRYRVLSPAHAVQSQPGSSGRRLVRGRSATASDLSTTMRRDLMLPSSLSHDTERSAHATRAADALGLHRSPMASPMPSPSASTSSSGGGGMGDGPILRPRPAGSSRRASLSASESPDASAPPSPVLQALQRIAPSGTTRLGSSLHATVARASLSGLPPRAGAVSPPEPPPLDAEMPPPAHVSLPARPPAAGQSQSEGGSCAPPSSPFATLSVHTGGDRSPAPPPSAMRKQNSAPSLVPREGKGGMGHFVSPPAPPARCELDTPTPSSALAGTGSLKSHVEKSSPFVEFSAQDIQVLEACCAEMVQSLAQHSLRMLAQKRSRNGGVGGIMGGGAFDSSPVHGRAKRMSRPSSSGSLNSANRRAQSPLHGSEGGGDRMGLPALDIGGGADAQHGLGFVDSSVERTSSNTMSKSQMDMAMFSFLSSYMSSVEGHVMGGGGGGDGTAAPTTPAFRPHSRRASIANIKSFRSSHKRSNTMQTPTSISAAASSAVGGGVGGFAPDTAVRTSVTHDAAALRRSVSARNRGAEPHSAMLSRTGSSASMGRLSTTSVSTAASELSANSVLVSAAPGAVRGTHTIAHSHSHRTMTSAASFTSASVGVLEEMEEEGGSSMDVAPPASRRAGVSWTDTAAGGTGVLAAARVRSLAGLDLDPEDGVPSDDDVPPGGMRVTLKAARDEFKRPLPSPLEFKRADSSTATTPGPPTASGPVGQFDFASAHSSQDDRGALSPPLPSRDHQGGDVDNEQDAPERMASTGNASVTLQQHDLEGVHEFDAAQDVLTRASPGTPGTPRAMSSDAGGNASPVALARGGAASGPASALAQDGDGPAFISNAAAGGASMGEQTELQHVPGVPVTVRALEVHGDLSRISEEAGGGSTAQSHSEAHSLRSAASSGSSASLPAELLGAYIPEALNSERPQLVLVPVPTVHAVHAAANAQCIEQLQLEKRIQRVLNQGSTVRFPVPQAPAPTVVSAWTDAVMNGNLPNVDTWAFRPWDVPIELMPVMFAVLVRKLGLFDDIPQLSVGVVLSFAAATLSGYNSNNEFHNMCHGLHVAQATYLLLRETCVFTALPPDEVLTLMVSALGHDVDHTGTNSFFLINSGSNLATRYNDASVLENYHCASLSAILAVEDFAVFDFASPQRQRRLRSLMLSCIMCTDMARHLEVVNSIQKLKGSLLHPAVAAPNVDVMLEAGDVAFEVGTVAACPQVAVMRSDSGNSSDSATLLDVRRSTDAAHAPEQQHTASGAGAGADDTGIDHMLRREDLVCDDEQQRTSLCGILLHCADISGQVTPWSTATVWSDCVLAEFKAQAAMEAELDLEHTAFMHSLSRPGGAGTLQKGFCDYVLHDLYSAMADLYPALQARVQQLQANAARHGAAAEEAKRAAGAAAAGDMA